MFIHILFELLRRPGFYIAGVFVSLAFFALPVVLEMMYMYSFVGGILSFLPIACISLLGIFSIWEQIQDTHETVIYAENAALFLQLEVIGKKKMASRFALASL